MLGKRILIPYFLAGSGHFAVAGAVQHYLNKKYPDLEVRLLEPAIEFKDELLNNFFKEAWKHILRMKKSTSQFLFDIDKAIPSLAKFINNQHLKLAILKGMGFLVGYQPDLILSTHWGCAHLFNHARKELDTPIPLFNVFTELAGGHKLTNCGADKYFAVSPQAIRDLTHYEIPEEDMLLINFIVRPNLIKGVIKKEDARISLGLPQDRFITVFNVGGEGLGHVNDFISAFTRVFPEGMLIVLAGRNEELFKTVQSSFSGTNVVGYGFREDIDRFLASADLLAGKCGGSFSMEAVMMGKPFVITNVGAPSERPNKDYILSKGYGWYTPKAEKFGRLLADLQRDMSLFEKVRENLASVPVINGAEQIADTIHAMLS
ncbi:MAG: hypothetical protein E4H36_10020 [Spirochaetales bacterium]|nr:MAG: hypothetical protein E4H36_10020 [Spirochaetales bacterium]